MKIEMLPTFKITIGNLEIRLFNLVLIAITLGAIVGSF